MKSNRTPNILKNRERLRELNDFLTTTVLRGKEVDEYGFFKRTEIARSVLDALLY